jgi:hypothetical protein
MFTAAIVAPEERTAAASLTTVARSVAVSASPLTSSLMLSGPLIACGAPLLLGGGLAIVYDLTMWRTFRCFPLAAEYWPLAVLKGRHRLRRGRAGAGGPDRRTAPHRTAAGPVAIGSPALGPDHEVPWGTRDRDGATHEMVPILARPLPWNVDSEAPTTIIAVHPGLRLEHLRVRRPASPMPER